MVSHWMFRCKDVSARISRSMDEPLPWAQRLAIEFHLLMCRYCARFRRQLRLLRKMSGKIDTDLPDCDPAEGLSENCKNRIKDALRSEK